MWGKELPTFWDNNNMYIENGDVGYEVVHHMVTREVTYALKGS